MRKKKLHGEFIHATTSVYPQQKSKAKEQRMYILQTTLVDKYNPLIILFLRKLNCAFSYKIHCINAYIVDDGTCS